MRAIAQSRDQKLLDGIIQHKYLRNRSSCRDLFLEYKRQTPTQAKSINQIIKTLSKTFRDFNFQENHSFIPAQAQNTAPKYITTWAINDVLIDLLSLVPNGAVLSTT